MQRVCEIDRRIEFLTEKEKAIEAYYEQRHRFKEMIGPEERAYIAEQGGFKNEPKAGPRRVTTSPPTNLVLYSILADLERELPELRWR